MCAIVCSRTKKRLKELFVINSYRGSLSWSILSHTNKSSSLTRSPGAITGDDVDNILFDGDYYVGHSQAPTTESKCIHPAEYNGSLLWHNGIVKQRNLDPNTWDTQWMLNSIVNEGWRFLDRIDGVFACVCMINDNLYTFRNEISPLFIDSDMSISSTTGNGFTSIQANVIFQIDYHNNKLEEIGRFKTKDNPYFFMED